MTSSESPLPAAVTPAMGSSSVSREACAGRAAGLHCPRVPHTQHHVFLSDDERSALLMYPMQRGLVANVTPINGSGVLRCAIRDHHTGGWIRLRELQCTPINRAKLEMMAAFYNHHARRAAR